MNKLIIYQYINKIKREDIINFSKTRGIELSSDELEIIYYYVKNEYKRFFYNPLEVLNEISKKVSNNTYNEIINLYNTYKGFI